MSWGGFYLVCFVVGFSLSVLALLGGAFHWSTGHGAHWLHFDSHGVGPGHGAADAAGHGGSVSPFNLATAMAFLAWFGGMGYLLTGRGHLGRVTVPIRAGGTGEIVYSQAGTRRSAGARSEDGTVVPRGSEVVVTRYEKGIAYVRSWEELAS